MTLGPVSSFLCVFYKKIVVVSNLPRSCKNSTKEFCIPFISPRFFQLLIFYLNFLPPSFSLYTCMWTHRQHIHFSYMMTHHPSPTSCVIIVQPSQPGVSTDPTILTVHSTHPTQISPSALTISLFPFWFSILSWKQYCIW